MMHPFKAVSLSYKKAPLAIRELLALNEAVGTQLLHMLRQRHGLQNLLILSTCNRTEVYYTAEHDAQEVIIEALGELVGLPDAARYQPYFTSLTDPTAAVRHFFEVALGLDAQVVGDMQISSQVKKAYQRSVEAQVAGPFLHRLVHTVLAANKRVQQETAFRDGAASTSYATLELAAELTAAVAQPRVLIVGLGEIGADICRHFGKSKRFAAVTVCNRTHSTALALAAECGLQALAFENLPHGLRDADVIISSIAAPAPFFDQALVAQLPVVSPKFFIDLSVPRSIAADVEQVPGVLVYNIDTIQNKATEALARRVAAIPQVQEIIAASMATLAEWSLETQVSPTIQKLKNNLEQLRQRELGRFGKNVGAAESQRLDEVTKALTQKFLKLPVLQLKAASQRGEANQLAAMLTELFNLDGQEAAA